MPTIKDIAKLAGVSVGTVSNVINNVDSVNIDNVNKVHSAMKDLGYVPKSSARKMKSDVNRMVNVVLPNIQEASFSNFYTELENHLSLLNYRTSLYLTNDIPIKEERILNSFLEEPPAAVIIVTCQPDNHECFQKLAENNIYMIFYARRSSADADFVLFDDRSCLREIVAKRIDEGKTRNLLFCGPESFSSEREFVKGYCDAYQYNDLPVSKDNIIHTDFNAGFSFRAFAQKLSKDDHIDTIITTSSILAASLCQTVDYMRKDLPSDLQIITIDGQSSAARISSSSVSYARPVLYAVETITELLITNLPRMPLLDHKLILLPYASYDLSIPQYSSGSSKSLRVLAPSGDISEGIRFVISYIESRTGLSVKLDSSPYEEMYDTIAAHRDDDTYDIYITDIVWLNDLAENGYLYDITGSLPPFDPGQNSLPPQILKYFCKCKGRDYGFPFIYTAQLLFYRRDLFEDYENSVRFRKNCGAELKPPTNWTEFNAVARFFTKKFNPDSPTEYGTTLGGRFSSAANVEYLTRLWSFQEDVFDQYGSVRMNTVNTRRAMESYVESYKYASPDSSEHWWDEQIEEFARGDAAMMVMYSSHATPIIDRQTSNIVGNIGYTSVPGEKHTLGGYSICINANTSNAEGSIQFARELCSGTLAKALTLLGCNSINLNPVDLNIISDIMPWYMFSEQAAENALPRILPAGKRSKPYKKAEQIIASAVRDCIMFEASNGGKQPESASGISLDTVIKGSLQSAQEQLEELIAE